MEYNVIISIAAEHDTQEAYIYYENQQAGLGERFLAELAYHYTKLQLHPSHYSFVSNKKTIRALSLKIFPFQIIYEIEMEEVYVFAIHHSRKHPDQFIKRL